MSGHGCDFCSRSKPALWEYPCDDFVMDTLGGRDYVSTGAWLACQQCHLLIEADDWATLADRSVGMHDPPQPMKAKLHERIRRLHAAFRRHRSGDPIPYERTKE